MKKEIEIREYKSNSGLQLSWENNFIIKTEFENNEFIISANTQGLTSLANHLLNLAQDEVPNGSHIHLDEYNSLEDGSIDIVLEKNSFV